MKRIIILNNTSGLDYDNANGSLDHDYFPIQQGNRTDSAQSEV